MSNFLIFTDTGSDIKADILADWGVKFAKLSFAFDTDGIILTDDTIESKTFYDRMRNGEVAKTSAVNIEGFKDVFRPELENGFDILYIGFSSGLSTTFNSGRIALEELSEEFPDRKLIAVDSLSASAGQGLLVKLAVDCKNSGKTIEEVAKFVEDNRLNLCHWFTVDDLVYLKRGGRVSPTVAFVGGLLGIKPIMHVDNEGHLVKVTTARGRKAALKAIVDKFDETAIDKNGKIFISHGDCIDDVNEVVAMVKEKYGNEVELVTDVGAVIGSHSGPGTFAFFYLGKER